MNDHAMDDSLVTRRAALGVLGAGVLGAALWPRRARSEASIPPGRVVVTYWEKWAGPEGEAIQRVVDRFNQSQGKIWVQRIAVSDIAGKAMVAIGGGDPPDVVGLYSYSVPLFAEARAAMPLDGFARRRRGATIDPESYTPAVRRLLTYEGRQWAGVNTCYALALYYNRGAFREAGLDADRPPRTVGELDASAQRLDRVGPGGRIERAGFLPNLPTWWPYFWPSLFGGRLYDPIAKRAIFADAATVAAYEWVGAYPRRLGAHATTEFANSYAQNLHSAQDPFLAGHAAMIVQGPWIANFIRRYAPALEYAGAPVPVEESIYDPQRPAGMVEADVLMIPRGCPHPEEAYEFVAFTQQRQVQEQLAADHCKSSPMRDVSPGFMENHPNPCVGVHDAVVRSPRVQILPQTRAWQQYADLTSGAFDAIWNGGAVRPVLARVEVRAQELIDKAEALRRRREGL